MASEVKAIMEQYLRNGFDADDFSYSKVGELFRAISVIWNQYWANENTIGSDPPVRDLNSAARFIREEYSGTEMDEVVSAMWGMADCFPYQVGLAMLRDKAIKFVEKNPKMMSEENNRDCLDYYELEDIEEDDSDDFSDCKTMEWQEQEDLKMYPKRSC